MATGLDGSISRKPCWVTWSYQEPHEKVRALSREMRKRGMKRVLDLGCGAGRHTVYLAQEGFEVYTLDISPDAVELTAQRLMGEGLQANLQQADMSALPYPDGFFDGIVSVSVLHHNTIANIRTAMGEIKRVLRPGGLFFATECAKGDYQEGRGEQIEDGTYLAPEDADQPGIPHHFFSEDEVRALLHGFRVVELERDAQEFVDGSGRQALSVHWDILAEKGGDLGRGRITTR
jgi:SAM-dependent methyltransferase